MNKEDTLEDYILKKRAYEEEKEALMHQRKKAISMIEEVQDRSLHVLQEAAPDRSLLIEGIRESEKMIDEVDQMIKTELHKVSLELDKLEHEYYKKFKNDTHES